jgi:hypothetical protein
MTDWGWQENGPASAAVSSAPAGGIQAEILRRQNMRLNPTQDAPFQISPQQRAGILAQQMGAGTYNGGGNKNGGMVQPNNGRPVGNEFAHGVQMNPIMGGTPAMSNPMVSPVGNYAQQLQPKIEYRHPMQPFQQLPPQGQVQQNNFNQDSGGSAAFNRAWSSLNNTPYNGKANQDALAEYLRHISNGSAQYKMPTQQDDMQQHTAYIQPMVQTGQNQQQALMMLLQRLLGGG